MPFIRLAVVFACALFFLSCSIGGTGRPIDFYTLEYPTPVFQGPGTDKIVKIDQFSSARIYDSTAMLYRPDAYKVLTYNYHKWKTIPADMVTDYLLRDFRHSGLFHAVFSYHQSEPARFTVGGGVDEFIETKEAEGWNAVLTLHVTLLDQSRTEAAEKVVFQKRYRIAQPIDGESPEYFAAGISAAMALISVQIIDDVNSAMKGGGAQAP